MNNNKYNSVFDSIYNYVKGSTMAAWVFVLSVVILIIGINGFAEDTYSSYVGLQMIEKTYNVKPASWGGTYWLMSVSFQVITVIAMFAYLSNKKEHWWGLWLALGAQGIDFVSDVWYRSNGTWTGWVSIFISFLMTFLFFTIGSEVALTFGLGLVAKMFVEGMSQLAILFRNIITGIGHTAQILASGLPGDKGATDSSVTHKVQDVKHQPQMPPQNNQSRTENREPSHKQVPMNIEPPTIRPVVVEETTISTQGGTTLAERHHPFQGKPNGGNNNHNQGKMR